MKTIFHGSLRYTSFILIALIIISYFPVFFAGFIWDDDMVVVQNPLMQSLDGLYHIWFSTHPIDYYPLTYTSLWIDYHVWGISATGYHIINLLLHLSNAILLMIVFKKLNIPFAGLAALLFAVHPVNVPSVAWITERKNVLCMFWFCLCVYNLLTFDERQSPKHYIIALSCFFFSLLSKSAVLMFPFVILLYHWWKNNHLTRRDILLSSPFFYISAIMGMISLWFQNNRAIGETIIRNDDFFSKIVSSIYAVGFYIQQSLIPINTSFVYPVNQDQLPLIMAIPGLLIIVVYLVYCLYDRNRAGFVGLLYVLLMIFPVLGFVDIYFMRYALVADHWQYFSICGVLGILMIGIDKVSQKVAFIYIQYGLVLWIAYFTIASFQYAQQFKDEPTLWFATLSNYPECSLALNRLGSIYQTQNNQSLARYYYDQTLKYHPDNPGAHNNLGMIEESNGNLNKAKKHFLAAIQHHQMHPHIHFNLGRIYMKSGNFALAEKSFQTCLRLQPGHESALIWLASSLEYQQKWENASNVYERLIQLLGKQTKFLNPLARVYETSQNHFQALRCYQDSIGIDDNQPDIYYQIALIYQRMGRIQQAIYYGKKAVDSDPEYPPYALFVALLIGEYGNLDDAVQYLSIGLQINENYRQTVAQLKSQPKLITTVQQKIAAREKKKSFWKDDPEKWYQQGNLYLVIGDLQNAQKTFEQCLALAPSHLRAAHNLTWLYAFNGNYPQSIHILKNIMSHHPDESAWMYYQMARLCALYASDICNYNEYIVRAIDAGFRNIEMLKTDPAFKDRELNNERLYELLFK